MMINVNEYEEYKTLEDLPVKTLCFKSPGNVQVKGVVQILHGMCEHKERYFEFIKYLNENGFICVISDMRGHGENVSFFKELGYFGENGAKDIINDVHAVTAYIKNNFPDLPLILLGHSMGSMVARAVLKYYDDDYDKAFILGSPSNNHFKAFGMLMAELIGMVRDEKLTSPFLDKLILGRYERRFSSEKLKNAWICSDVDVVNKYNEDTKCNFTFTINGYYTLLNIMNIAYSKNKWVLKNKRMPIYFMSGSEDPCMVNEEQFYKSVENLKEKGYRHVETTIYEGMRHEILNEKDKYKVYKDILEKMINTNETEEIEKIIHGKAE